MNVLITSAGRRTSLVRAFQEAVHPMGGCVFAGDIDPLAPALYLADKPLRLPRIQAPDYIDALLTLVDEYQIRIIVPTIDTELPILAASKTQFASRGCVLLVSSEDMVAVAADKWLTYKCFAEAGIAVPLSWLPADLSADCTPLRMFVKPRMGSASLNVFRANPDTLPDVLRLVPNPIIQEEVAGSEITIDAYINFQGIVCHYVPRLRIKTIGGESVEGVTIPDDDFRHWVVRVLELVAVRGGVGPITLQAFLTPQGPVLNEINPRFGGGFPLAHAAGARYPEWVLRDCRGETVLPAIGDYQTGLSMTRHYTELFVEDPLWH